MWFLFLLISLFFPFKIQAESADISATIVNNNPPTITFITPVNGQTGVPADADIVVEISNASYGVDINSVEIIINGVTYTAASPRVSITGDILDYIFTTTPYDPLFTNQANTVLVKAANLNNNSTQSSIVFNVPVITPTPTPTIIPTITTTPTITPTTTNTPTPTPTGISATNTPTQTPTPRITSYITSTPTPRLTLTPTPTSIYPNCPTCPICSISPTSTPIPTTSDVTPTPYISTPDTVSPIITFIKPASKGYLKTNQDFIIQVSDINSGINKDTIKITFEKQVFTLANTQMSITGNSQSFRVTLKNKFQLLPNTEYKISVSAFDLDQNGISKSIFFQVSKPFPYLSLLLIIPIGGLIWLFIFTFNKKNKNNQTIGHIFNSLTLEPIPFIKVDINHQKFISNIFGILSVNLKPGQYSINIKDPNFSFPAKNIDQPLDYPQYYWGQPFDLQSKSNIFLDIALDPYKTKNIFYKISQIILGKPGIILDSKNQPVIGLKLALVETKFKTIVTSRVVDNSGHYRFIVPHGRYQLVIFGTDTIIDTIDTRHRIFGYTIINKNYIINHPFPSLTKEG